MQNRSQTDFGRILDAVTLFNAHYPRPRIAPLSVSEPFHLAEDYVGKSFPNSDMAGVYLIFDADGNLLYIGKADGIGRRLGAHFGWNHDRTVGVPKSASLAGAYSIRTIGIPLESWFEASAVEAFLIDRLAPRLNVVGRKQGRK